MSALLTDNYGRTLNYLRVAVTDRCNLRCTYCMPEEGINFVSRQELLDYEELIRLLKVFVKMGTKKIRLTGGEPFVRKDLMVFLEMISQLEGLEQWSVTTNGTSTNRHIPDLKKLGVHSVNLSLDTLDKDRFAKMTRRDRFPLVWKTLENLVEHNINTKVNMVVMKGVNTQDLVPMATLTKEMPIEVRFIEEMPFNGGDHQSANTTWSYNQIRTELEKGFGPLEDIPTPPNSTALLSRIPGSKGNLGIIPAFSRTICQSCNRLRLTPQGIVKTCLYDKGVFNMRDLLRAGATDEQIRDAIGEAVKMKAKDGFEAEKISQRNFGSFESMTTIGG